MVKFLIIIKVWRLEINILALTELSDFEIMFNFMGFIPHRIEQQCVFSVYKDKYSRNSMLKTKVSLGSKLILILIFHKVNLNYF